MLPLSHDICSRDDDKEPLTMISAPLISIKKSNDPTSNIALYEITEAYLPPSIH